VDNFLPATRPQYSTTSEPAKYLLKEVSLVFRHVEVSSKNVPDKLSEISGEASKLKVNFIHV